MRVAIKSTNLPLQTLATELLDVGLRQTAVADLTFAPLKLIITLAAGREVRCGRLPGKQSIRGDHRFTCALFVAYYARALIWARASGPRNALARGQAFLATWRALSGRLHNADPELCYAAIQMLEDLDVRVANCIVRECARPLLVSIEHTGKALYCHRCEENHGKKRIRADATVTVN